MQAPGESRGFSFGDYMRQGKIEKIIHKAEDHIDLLCHVEGWSIACVFKLESTNDGLHTLITPKSGRVYRTRRPLLYTRRQIDKQIRVKEKYGSEF